MLKKVVVTLKQGFLSVWLWSQENISELLEDKSKLKYLSIGLGVVMLILVGLGVFWSREPGTLSIRELALKYCTVEQWESPADGVVTTATLLGVSEVLLNKPGGYVNNDVLPPGVWLDNMPSWEYGVVQQIRDLSGVMSTYYGLLPETGSQDPSLRDAAVQFQFKHNSWVLPSTEGEYRSGNESLHNYLIRLMEEDPKNASFNASTANFLEWLALVESRLDSLTAALNPNVGPLGKWQDIAVSEGVDHSDKESQPTTSAGIDNIFFNARGSSWALIHFLRAAEMEFASVLQEERSQRVLHHVLLNLEATQQPISSPFILNGKGFGMLANHSLVMSTYITMAHDGVAELRSILAEEIAE